MFLLLTAVAIIWVQNLFAVVILSGVYSLLMAGTFTILDAVDVAFTEAAVGAGITTVLMVLAIALTGQKEKIIMIKLWFSIKMESLNKKKIIRMEILMEI